MNIKKITRLLIWLPFLISLHAAAQTDRDLILQKVRVRYIPSPNTSLQIINIPNSLIATGSNTIFGIMSENGMDSSAKFLRQLMQLPVPFGQGNMGLQQMVASTLRITGDSVIFNIYNDAAVLNAFAKANFLGSSYPDNHVWPAAWRGDKYASQSGTNHTGYVQFGEHFLRNNGGVPEMRRTIIHEIMHTQDFSDLRVHIWGAFRYGADQDHYGWELIPNMADAFGEGIANSMVYLYHQASRNQVLNWYGSDNLCGVEATIPAGTSVPASQWLYTQISSTNPPGPGAVPANPNLQALNYRVYNLHRLPSRFIMHNEQIVGIIGAEYARKLGRDRYFQALRTGNGQMFRVSTSAVARWMEALCSAALPSGLTLESVARTSRAEMPYLFPLALADYLTYYRSQSLQDFRAMFENSISQEWADLYWTAARQQVRQQVPITMTGGNPPVRNAAAVSAAIDRIATLLGARP